MKEIIKMLEDEKDFHESLKEQEDINKEYRTGFISGLDHAISLIKKSKEMSE